MLVHSRSDHQTLKAHFFIKRVSENTQLSDYTTVRVQKSVLEEMSASVERSQGCFVPFWKERDSLGRLIKGSRSLKGSRARGVKTEAFVKTASHSPAKKPETHQKLLVLKVPVIQTPTSVPAVGTYHTFDTWIKKSFRCPRNDRQRLSSSMLLAEQSKNSSVERVNKRTDAENRSNSPLRRLRRKRGPMKLADTRSDDDKRRNNFSMLRLQGLPGELMENLSFPKQRAMRDVSMERFRALSKAVMKRIPQIF